MTETKTENYQNFTHIVEWAVWAHLDGKKDLELLLLKGHLLIEIVLMDKLHHHKIQNSDSLSFHGKIKAIEKLELSDTEKKAFIIKSLQQLNKLRNCLAHEYLFDLRNSAFEAWGQEILQNLEGTKVTKFTFRTKIVHAFSTLARGIRELS